MMDKEEERIFSLFNEVLLFNIRYGESCLTSTCITGVQSVRTRIHLERTHGHSNWKSSGSSGGPPFFFFFCEKVIRSEIRAL